MRTILITIMMVILIAVGMNTIKEQANTIEQYEELLEEVQELRQEVQELRQEVQELQERIQQLEDKWNVGMGEITAYAPTCSTAIEGWSYEGNPSITASGEKVEIGKTIAAGPDFEFGTKVWIEGFGWRIVQDRGGAIGPGQFDIAVETRQEALRFGRQERVIIYENN